MATMQHEVFRAVVAKVSRLEQPSVLQRMWELRPPDLPDGAPPPAWPLAERVGALYGALRYGCELPPSPLDGCDSDEREWSMRPEDVLAAISLLILLVPTPDGTAAAQSPTRPRRASEWPEAWPPSLRAAADALHASAARQLVLQPIMCDEMGTAVQCFDAVFSRSAHEAEPQAEERRTGLGAYSPEWAASPARTPARASPDERAHEVDTPLPMGPLARAAERELAALLDGVPAALGHTAAMGSPAGGEETQWGTQAAGMYAMRADVDDLADEAMRDAANPHHDDADHTAQRARERQAAACALAAAHPPSSHFELQRAFLDLLEPWLPEQPLEAAILRDQAQLQIAP